MTVNFIQAQSSGLERTRKLGSRYKVSSVLRAADNQRLINGLSNRIIDAVRADGININIGGDIDEKMTRYDSVVERYNAGNSGLWTDYRADAANPGGLGAGALRQMLNKVLQEPMTSPNGLRLFGVDSEVQLGARTFAVRKEFAQGDARVWRGPGEEIPTVSFGEDEMEFKVKDYVTSAVWDYFQEISARYTGTPLAPRLLRIARMVLEQFLNEMTWYGDQAHQIYGVFNYPWLDKEFSDLEWYGQPEDARDYVTEFNAFFNKQHHESFGLMGPNKVVTSPRVRDWIMQTPYASSTDIGSGKLLGEVITGSSAAGQASISSIESAWECQDVLAPGWDAMLFYRDDDLGIKNVVPGGGIRALPLYKGEMHYRQIMTVAHGGVVMYEVGNMLLVFVKASAEADSPALRA